jgi:hypothetical protein
LPEVANTAYLKGFLFSGLPCVAPYCVPGGVRLVSRVSGLRVVGSIADQFHVLNILCSLHAQLMDRKRLAATGSPDSVSRLYCAWLTRFPSPYSDLEVNPG